MEQKKGYMMVCLAGCLWGTLGMFGKILFGFNFTPELVVFCRLFFAFWILVIFMMIKDRTLFKIDKRGLKYTMLMGFFSQALFNVMYFQSIKQTTIATAVVLLYTAPIFLIIMGRIIYKEKLTRIKIIALVLCVVGCFLTVTGGSLSVLKMDSIGILMGIGAGFNYSLVTIFSKAIIDDYHPLTVIFYSFGFGWIFLIPVSHPLDLLQVNYTLPLVITLFGFGFIPSVLSYILYISGLSKNVEASKAGIICSVEIVVSVIISFAIYKEMIVGLKLVGICLVLVAIILVNIVKTNQIEPQVNEKKALAQ